MPSARSANAWAATNLQSPIPRAPRRPLPSRSHFPSASGTLPIVESQDWVHLLKALADETRLRIVSLLLNEPLSVGQLAERLDATNYNVSKHLRILREAGVVTSSKHGRLLQSSITPAFRRRLSDDQTVLDLGCCRFNFDHFE